MAEEFNHKPHPTIGTSDDVDEGARLFFEGCFPLRWKKRKQAPDIHIDYRVEIVENGEPSGLHFQAQVKGRSIHKRKAKNLAEPIKTKHLRYYLRCEEPVFLFLIDPIGQKGNWVFIQRYLKSCKCDAALKTQKTLAIQFDAERSCENLPLFEKELREAWGYMRDLHPGSPMAAILAKKQHLERLDSRYQVQIAATSESMKIQVKPHDALTRTPPLKFLKDIEVSALKDFHEKGKSFQVKACEIEMDDSPIHNAILRELGNAKVTISDGRRVKGCVQLSFHHETEQVMLQIDGEWQLATKILSFKGQLSESPLKIELTRERNDANNSEQTTIVFNCDWAAWEQQALLSLAYFKELEKLIRNTEILVRCLVRGNALWKAEKITVESEAREKVAKALNWLQKCIHVARQLGTNPPFPLRSALNKLESDDVRLLVKLIEEGKHEQGNEGETTIIEADIPPGSTPPPKEATRMESSGHVMELNFFGLKVPFGPLTYTWTNLKLIELAPMTGQRFKFTWKGAANSAYSISYDNSSQTTKRT